MKAVISRRFLICNTQKTSTQIGLLLTSILVYLRGIMNFIEYVGGTLLISKLLGIIQ